MLITSVFKYIMGPVVVAFCGSAFQSNRSTAGEAATGGADQLTGSNIDRLLLITENSTNLLQTLSKTMLAQQSTSGVEMLEASENRALENKEKEEMATECDTETTGQLDAEIRGIESELHLPSAETDVPDCVSKSALNELPTSVNDIKVDKTDNLMEISKYSFLDDDDIVVLGRFDEDDEFADYDKCNDKIL